MHPWKQKVETLFWKTWKLGSQAKIEPYPTIFNDWNVKLYFKTMFVLIQYTCIFKFSMALVWAIWPFLGYSNFLKSLFACHHKEADSIMQIEYCIMYSKLPVQYILTCILFYHFDLQSFLSPFFCGILHNSTKSIASCQICQTVKWTQSIQHVYIQNINLPTSPDSTTCTWQ